MPTTRREHIEIIWRSKIRPIWNWIIYGIFIGLLLLSFFSAPIEQFDIFTSRPTTLFPFTLTRDIQVNGKVVSYSVLADGVISFVGKGGVSADNPLTTNITMYFNATAFGKQPSRITVRLPAAFTEVPGLGSLGIPHWVEIGLTRKGDYWVSEGIRIKYSQGGTEPIIVSVDNQEFQTAENVQVSSQDVTVATRTNSLVLCLTWAILAFTVLELRIENNGHKCQQSDQNN